MYLVIKLRIHIIINIIVIAIIIKEGHSVAAVFISENILFPNPILQINTETLRG